MAAGGSGIAARRALPALVIGSSVFLQLHLALGIVLGPAARDLLDEARGPAVAVLALLVVGAAVFWWRRRRGRAAGEAWTEAACPACLALSVVGERLVGLPPAEKEPVPARR